MHQATCPGRLPRSLNPFGMRRVLGEEDWGAVDTGSDVDDSDVNCQAVDVASDDSFSPSSFADETRVSVDHGDSVDESDSRKDRGMMVDRKERRWRPEDHRSQERMEDERRWSDGKGRGCEQLRTAEEEMVLDMSMGGSGEDAHSQVRATS